MIEVDFMWVGEKTKTGDAIACRFTHPSTGQYVVMVIDGGFRDDGARLAALIKKYYDTTHADLVVCTHPDDDHIQGLFGIFENMSVGELLVHRPSLYGYSSDAVKSGTVEDLVKAAVEQGTTLRHDFAGVDLFGGALRVAGPSEEYYELQLSAQLLLAQKSQGLGGLVTKATQAIRQVFNWRSSDPGETLTDDNGGTTPRNNSSIIMDLQVDGYRVLFTGDAGAPALTLAADHLDAVGRSSAISLFDVPHHGSRHNLTKDLLDRLLGVETFTHRGESIISVGKEADDFPRPEVANALKRRGYPWQATRGKDICWSRGADARPDYSPMVTQDWLDE